MLILAILFIFMEGMYLRVSLFELLPNHILLKDLVLPTEPVGAALETVIELPETRGMDDLGDLLNEPPHNGIYI
jgi:hypothetical protein